jgi:hypothetical protein
MGAFGVKATTGGGGGEYDIAPAGNHVAVLVALIDLGTQENSGKFQSKPARRVQLVWELTAEKSEKTGHNVTIGRDYPVYFNEKAGLRQMIEGWFGKTFQADQEFDLEKLVGQPCMVNVVHKKAGSGNDYAKVEGVKGLPKGLPKPAPTLPFTVWYIGCGKPIPDAEWIPWIVGKPVKDVIAKSPEFQGKPAPATNGAAPVNGAAVNQDADDPNGDLPF